MKTSELTGAALDWAVAKCEGHIDNPNGWLYEATLEEVADGSYHPAINWAQGGPIIEREKLGFWMSANDDHKGEWACATDDWMDLDIDTDEFLHSPMPYHGVTPLIAAMRCYVASKLGDEVDVPAELH